MASSRRRRTGPVGEGANLTGSFHPSLWWASVPARRASAGRSVGRHPARSASMLNRVAVRAVRDALGGRPTVTSRHASPAHAPTRRRSPPRQPPPRRHPHRLRFGRDPVRRPRPARGPRTDTQPPMWPSQRCSAALDPPIGAPISPDRPPPRPRGRFADRPAGCRVAHRRSPRLWPSTQGPPAPHPATLAQFPPAHQARGPIAAHTIDGFSDFGFWVLVLNWDFGIEIRGLGDHAEVSRVSVVTPKSTLCVRTRILPLRLL